MASVTEGVWTGGGEPSKSTVAAAGGRGAKISISRNYAISFFQKRNSRENFASLLLAVTPPLHFTSDPNFAKVSRNFGAKFGWLGRETLG